MIRALVPAEEEYVRTLIQSDQYQNVYLYIDMFTLGFQGEKIRTMILTDNSAIKVVIYQYYNSIQLFQVNTCIQEEICELSAFLREGGFSMVSGTDVLTAQIAACETIYEQFSGVIMKYESTGADSECVEWAGIEDCRSVAELICTDKSIGGHYQISELEKQLRDRMEHWGCRTAMIRKDGKIVSHVSTYAEMDGIGVIGGLITDSAYRGKGLGLVVLNSMNARLLQEHKTPVLYCYQQDTIDWYLRHDWKIMAKCGKLEVKK